MTFAARLEILADARQSPRRSLTLGASVLIDGAKREGCIVYDLSTMGLLIEAPEELFAGEELVVLLAQGEGALARVVWNKGRLYGCEFIMPISTAVVSAAVLSSPAERGFSASGESQKDCFAQCAKPS